MFYVVMYLFVTLWLVHYVTKEIRNCPYCGRKMNPKYQKFGVMWKCKCGCEILGNKLINKVMKANEAPEKLYLISDEDGVYLSYDPPTKLQGDRYDFVDKEVFPIEEGTDIEYTRTDAFIDKAVVWISNNCYIPHNTLEDFEKYMKGEGV